MKARPILFSAPMVRAIRNGQKTQTRRVVKPPRESFSVYLGAEYDGNDGFFFQKPNAADYVNVRCPYGRPGDRLWVRETVWLPRAVSLRDLREGADTWPKCIYSADTDATEIEWMREFRWTQRPSIHCPRWASRITLEVSGVRVERLQAISFDDVVSEGVRIPVDAATGNVLIDISSKFAPAKYLPKPDPGSMTLRPRRIGKASEWNLALARAHYASLWEEINGAGSWAANPWVWVVEFKRVQP